MKIEQKAGGFTLTTFTDGCPHFVKVVYRGDEMTGLMLSDLYDLEYACKRMIANLEEVKSVENERRKAGA